MDFKVYFNNKDLKKIPNKGIHFEQKTTPDLVWCVSHVILNLISKNENLEFTDKDVRNSEVFNDLMQDYFSKPPQEQAENEYNKVSSYQLGLLAYSGVLEQVAERPKKYKVIEKNILEFLSLNDLNSSKFLTEYTEKFLKDNGLINIFNKYRENPNHDNYVQVKDSYWEWAKINTAIRGDDRKHTYRVFNKIFNLFCYKNRIPGEDASNLTDGPCPYSFLLYNRKNFRDTDLPVGMTRRRYQEEILSEIEEQGVVEVLLGKVKEEIKNKTNNESEINDTELGYTPNSGTHIHHIFPKSSYPQLSLLKENLIALTPGQHLSYAHEKGNTRKINKDFQKICLIHKIENIEKSIMSSEKFYSKFELIKMLNIGLNLELTEETTLKEIKETIKTI